MNEKVVKFYKNKLRKTNAILDLKISNFSRYKNIQKTKPVISDRIFRVNNLPLKIEAYLMPMKDNKDIDIGVYLDAGPIKELFPKGVS